ncbi:hypothetical protein PSTG_04015 [Puccinia striiformis f. sp. tritici PST-78]|uniref:Uncharacterized protein n=1 Tax=Puccinia striiformis f. sp. tritici PST-78 TaxID=1165861 RepID=A0A0L0VUP0_9BASI|nr:hypothetical protein PSTG_04015 [Puccinia striiformis f. sp. tritici PST-78]
MAIMIPAYWPKSTLTRCSGAKARDSTCWQMKSQVYIFERADSAQHGQESPPISLQILLLVSKRCQWGSESGDRVGVGHLISSRLLPVGFGVGKPSRSGVVLLSMT